MKYQITQTTYINQAVGNLSEYHVVEADNLEVTQSGDMSKSLVLFYRGDQTVAAFEGFDSIVEYKEGEDPHVGS